MIHYRTIDSPIGPLTLAGSGSALTNLRMVDQTYEPSHGGWSLDRGHSVQPSTNSRPISPASSSTSISNSICGVPNFSSGFGRHC